MNFTNIIIDNFFDNADQVKNLIKTLHFQTLNKNANYHGRNCNQAINIDGITEVISDIIGESLVPKEKTSHCKPRLTLEGDKGVFDVHIDPCHWSGIIYMNDGRDLNSGTQFYHHLPTNLDHAPTNQAELSHSGLADYSSVWQDVIKKDSVDKDKWELVSRIPMVYNRLVLFRPWYYHGAGLGFGSNIEDGRLIIPLFFKSKNQ